MRENLNPILLKARKIPNCLEQNVENKIKKLQQKRIIEKVDHQNIC